MNTVQIASLLAAVVLAAAHVHVEKLRFLSGIPRSAWLSGFGGISVAYVFVHLLPKLAEAQQTISEALGEEWRAEGWRALESHVYLISLVGLAIFYGVERHTAEGRKARSGAPEVSYDVCIESGASQHGGAATNDAKGGAESSAGPQSFWLSMASFAVYNFLIGYLLLHRFGSIIRVEGEAGRTVPDSDMRGLVLFVIAMLLHFLINDYGLLEKHLDDYRRFGRWMLAGAVVLGWLAGLLAEIPEPLIASLTAFLAGGIILNVLKEELPEERRSRFWPFALGAGLYAILLVAL